MISLRAPSVGRLCASRHATTILASTSARRLPLSFSAASLHTTPYMKLRDFFPVKETHSILKTPAAWEHHGYTEQELDSVVPAHREPKSFSDWVAWKLVRIARWGMDRATGMSDDQKVDKEHPTTAVETSKPLTEAQWLVRFVFLESIAGVPGMVGGMLRHLGSIRRLKRDNGWIETLLEESYNERMHLLIFMKMCEPGWFMKMMIIGAQGVFFNTLFIAYLMSPRVVHRFVGYLEEEAVHTYSLCIRQLETGQLPKWNDPSCHIPGIACQYFKMPEDKRTMKDLIRRIRADESTHRSVNHTMASLNQKEDPNPFVSNYKEPGRKPPRPIERALGWERDEVI